MIALVNILVAGATGVVGRRAIPLMLEKGHRVSAVARSPANRAALEQLGAAPLEVDLFDLAKVRTAARGHDVVVNLASSIPPSSKSFLPWAWRENTRVRRYVSANLAAAAKEAGAERLIQESFAPTYLDAGDDWIEESWPVKPPRYNRGILDAERAAAQFGATGATATVLRFGYFYGPDSDFVHDTIRMLRKGWAPCLGSPDAYISSISHDDSASAVMAALTAPGGTYNVADDEPLKKREFYNSLADALGVQHPRFPPRWLSHITGSLGEMLSRSQRISNRKLRSVGWAPGYPSVRAGWPYAIPA